MALTDQLVSYCRLEEASSTRVNAVGGGGDFTPSGGFGNRAGKLGNAVDVGSSDYLYSTSSLYRAPSGTSFTVAHWVYFDTVANAYGFTVARYQNDGDWGIGPFGTVFGTVNNARMFVVTAGGVNEANTAAGTIVAGQWHYMVGWFDHTVGTHGTVYCQVDNGTVASTALTSARASGVTERTYINGIIDGVLGCDAAIDEVGFWSRVLTSDERTALYNSGAGLAYPFTTSTPFALQVAAHAVFGVTAP